MRKKKLSIITINFNNVEGLRKTIESVLTQTYRDIEYIIIDGASTDGSVDVIRASALQAEGLDFKWISEPDKGIYDGMNKGIEIALGKRVVNAFNCSEFLEDKNKELPDYVYILNSGDALAAPDVVERMLAILNDREIDVLLGNIIQIYPNNKRKREKKFVRDASEISPRPIDVSMFTFYRSMIPQDAAFVRREMFEKYGYFDDNLKICADWKLYLNMMVLGGVQPMYVDIDVVSFDMSGVSNTNEELRLAERRTYLEEILHPAVLKDYDKYSRDIIMMQRLHRHSWAYRLTWCLERVLYKLEEWRVFR